MLYKGLLRKLHRRYFYLGVLVWAASIIVAVGYTGLAYYKGQVLSQYDNVNRQIASFPVSKESKGVTEGVNTTVSVNDQESNRVLITQNSIQEAGTSVHQSSATSTSQTTVASTSPSASNPQGVSKKTTAASPDSSARPSESNSQSKPKSTVSTCVIFICMGL